MVHHRHQHMLLIGDPEQPRPQRDLAPPNQTGDAPPLDGPLQPIRRPAAGINNIPTEVGPLNRDNQLLRYPLGGDKQRAQALMAAHHISQRRPQRLGIQPPTEPQRHRHVVDRRGPLQLLEEPQPALGKRQRHHRRPHNRHHRPQPTRCLARRGANRATVGASNNTRTPRSASRPALTAATSRIADNESPPSSKNESSTPTRSTPSTRA